MMNNRYQLLVWKIFFCFSLENIIPLTTEIGSIKLLQGVQGATCGGGSVGDGICPDPLYPCCSEWGWCGNSVDHCGSSPSPTPCGGGVVGDGVCQDTTLCCSSFGWCGSSPSHCSGPTAPTPTAPAPVPTPVAAPVNVPPTEPVSSSDDSRMIAYVANWLACPDAAQLAQYTHVVVAFAVTYTYASPKNICNPDCTITSTPVCTTMDAATFINQMHASNKKVILSFGGAGMGGSWSGDVNDCWEYCFGRETEVVNQLTSIVKANGYDGIDLDYEYHIEGRTVAQNFLTLVTTGLRNSLPVGSIVTHAPMDSDLMPTSAYFGVLQNVASSLDFLMPQYYNGYTRPAVDGIDGTGAGSMAALTHYTALVDDLFNGDATKVVFGFCISDCSGTGSNVSGSQASTIMADLASTYPCNGGAFFWVGHHDAGASWSSVVNQVVQINAGCSDIAITASPVQSPVITTPAPIAPSPVMTTPAPIVITPAPVVTTPAPAKKTPAPQAATPAPQVTTTAPQATTPAPQAITPAPFKATPAPIATTASPVGSSSTTEYFCGKWEPDAAMCGTGSTIYADACSGCGGAGRSCWVLQCIAGCGGDFDAKCYSDSDCCSGICAGNKKEKRCA